MNKELISPVDLFWKPNRCCYCQGQFIPQDFQQKNYHLFELVLSLSSEMLVMLFHKKCFTEFDQGLKTAEEQIKNDPIYRWSIGELTKLT